MQPGVVATRDDTSHPIANVGEVPLSHVGQKGKLMNMLHVPTITKNLVLVGQIVDQGMEVRFTHLGCFIEEEGRVIAHADINLWHKRIGHVNYQRLQDLESKQVVFRLAKFSGRKAQVCEACQLGKQH